MIWNSLFILMPMQNRYREFLDHNILIQNLWLPQKFAGCSSDNSYQLHKQFHQNPHQWSWLRITCYLQIEMRHYAECLVPTVQAYLFHQSQFHMHCSCSGTAKHSWKWNQVYSFTFYFSSFAFHSKLFFYIIINFCKSCMSN